MWGKTAAQFYAALWNWLFDQGHLTPADLPVASGKARYSVASSPVHANGKHFIGVREIRPGVFVEMNMSRPGIIGRVRKELTARGIPFEVVVGSED